MLVDAQQVLGGLLETESDEECKWMLTAFLEAFGDAPDVIFFALRTIWAGTDLQA